MGWVIHPGGMGCARTERGVEMVGLWPGWAASRLAAACMGTGQADQGPARRPSILRLHKNRILLVKHKLLFKLLNV